MFLLVKNDLWIGLQNFEEEKLYDETDLDESAFQTTLVFRKMYANGKDYMDKVSYNVGLRRWINQCMYLKSSRKYKTSQTDDCDLLKSFICKWNSKTFF